MPQLGQPYTFLGIRFITNVIVKQAIARPDKTPESAEVCNSYHGWESTRK